MKRNDIFKGMRVTTPYGVGSIDAMPYNEESDTLMVELDVETYNYFGTRPHKFVVCSLKQLKAAPVPRIPKRLKGRKAFRYQIYTFIPAGSFADYGIEDGFVAINRCLTHDDVMGIWLRNRYNTPRFDWSHKGFYIQAEHVEDDVFYCVDLGRYYVPCENELFQLKEDVAKRYK